MKKLAIGCLVVFVVCAIGAGVVGYVMFHKATSYLRQFEALATLDKNVTNTAPFTPPSSGELTEDMVKRFVAVQEGMHATLGSRVDQLKATQDEMQRRQQAEGRQASAREAITAVTGMMSLIVEAKKAQVDALNQSHFSLAEYSWVRGQVYSAAGLNIAQLAFSGAGEVIGRSGEGTKPLDRSEGTVPPRNKELVAPYIPKLNDWAVLAFFGL